MRFASSIFQKQIIDQAAGSVSGLAPQVLARRARQRRQILGMVAFSYLLDAIVLLIYASAGTISFAVGPAYAMCGFASVAIFAALSEMGFNDRFEDHYLVVPQTTVSLAIIFGFAYVAPAAGVVFLCAMFLTFAYGSLRSSTRQTIIGWTTALTGLSFLFLVTDKPIGLPHGNYMERFGSLMEFALVLGRGMLVGIISSSLRESLYKRGLQLKEAYQRIEELAELDELTGALNRRSIMQTLNDEAQRAHRSGVACSVALIDLDWFKKINDQFGHPVGDEVLRTFAISVFANIRSIDKFGRYGGEEFLLILPETSDEAAARTVDRLRAIVADLDWSAFSQGMNVTISAGIATFGSNEDAESILVRADAALYQAKRQGRNRVLSS